MSETNPSREEVEAWLAPLIGRITIRWNELQELVYMMFDEMLYHDPRGHAIFFAVKSDSAQRDMTIASFESVFGRNHALASEMRTLFAEIGKAAGRRNDAVHTQWLISTKVPGGIHVPRHSRLHGKDAKVELETCLSEIDALYERVSNLWFRVHTLAKAHSKKTARKVVREGVLEGRRSSIDSDNGQGC